MPIAHFYIPDHKEALYIPVEDITSPDATLAFALGSGAVFSTYPKGYVGDITPAPWRGHLDYDQFVLEMRPSTDKAAKVHIFDPSGGAAGPNFATAFTTDNEVAAIEGVRTVYLPSAVAAMGITKARSTTVIEFGAIVTSVTTDFVVDHRDIWHPY